MLFDSLVPSIFYYKRCNKKLKYADELEIRRLFPAEDEAKTIL